MAEKKVDIFLPLYVGDYLADTRELSAEEHGAYLLLLMGAWRRGGRLPSDPVLLARMAAVPAPRWKRVWRMISRFFVEVDGELEQPRLVRELTKAGRFNRAASIAGKESARVRLERNGTNRPNLAKSPDRDTNGVREPLAKPFVARSPNVPEDPHSHSESQSDPERGSDQSPPWPGEPTEKERTARMFTADGITWAIRREVERVRPEIGMWQPGQWAGRALVEFLATIPSDRRTPAIAAEIQRRAVAFAASEDPRVTKGGKWSVEAFCENYNALAAPTTNRPPRLAPVYELPDLPKWEPRPPTAPRPRRSPAVASSEGGPQPADVQAAGSATNAR